MNQDRNHENLAPLPSPWTKSFFLSLHLPATISWFEIEFYSIYKVSLSTFMSGWRFTFNFVIPSKESSLSRVEFLLTISRFLQWNQSHFRLRMLSKSCTLSNSTMWHLLLGVVSCLSVIVSLTFGDEWVANTGIFLTWSLELLDGLISSFPEFQVRGALLIWPTDRLLYVNASAMDINLYLKSQRRFVTNALQSNVDGEKIMHRLARGPRQKSVRVKCVH